LTTVDSSSDDRENFAPPHPFIAFILLLLIHPRRSGIMKFWRLDDELKEKREDQKEKYTYTTNLI